MELDLHIKIRPLEDGTFESVVSVSADKNINCGNQNISFEKAVISATQGFFIFHKLYICNHLNNKENP